MTTFQFIVFCVLCVLLAIIMAWACWRCFRKTGVRFFLLLGGFLILWPSIDTFWGAYARGVSKDVILGRRAYVFPLSLMKKTMGGELAELWTQQAAVADRHMALLWLVYFAAIALMLAVIARALKSPSVEDTLSENK